LKKLERLLLQFQGRQEPEATALQQQPTGHRFEKKKSLRVFFISVPVTARA
jgi:hypothetical protein